jgi:hypothetical protein
MKYIIGVNCCSINLAEPNRRANATTSGGWHRLNSQYAAVCYNQLAVSGGSNVNGEQPIMKEATKRSIFRWIHIIFSIPILGYIYSPFEEVPKYADRVRFVVVPVMLVSGLWMWKGHVVRRLISRRSAKQEAALKQLEA